MKVRTERFCTTKLGTLFSIERRMIDDKPLYVAVIDGIAYGGDETRHAAIDRMYRRLAVRAVGGQL